MEFLEPKCSVLGLCRSVASVASIAWILAALARGNDGASAVATALPGLQGLQELTVDLSFNLENNEIGPAAQWVPLEACNRGLPSSGFQRGSLGRVVQPLIAFGFRRLRCLSKL